MELDILDWIYVCSNISLKYFILMAEPFKMMAAAFLKIPVCRYALLIRSTDARTSYLCSCPFFLFGSFDTFIRSVRCQNFLNFQ